MVARWQDLPGQELFQYVDEDEEVRSIDSADVNDYLRDAAGTDVTSKTFRTWAATVLAMRSLARAAADARPQRAHDGAGAAKRHPRRDGKSKAKRVREVAATPPRQVRGQVLRAMEDVAEALGNTPAVVRGSYVHPAVVAAHAAGTLTIPAEVPLDDPTPTPGEEKALLRVLRAAHRAEREATRSKTPGR